MGSGTATLRSREPWDAGDMTRSLRRLEPVSTILVEALAVAPGLRVLDVGAGHGNCALAAARRGATVTASDFSPTMLAAGRARTEAEGADIAWIEADAADLPFDDDAFDRVTSVFGAIFAPDHEAVARELVRVTAPGGQVGFTAWPPDGLAARMAQLAARFWAPFLAGRPSPFAWGDPDEVGRRFAPFDVDVRTTTRTLTYRYDSWAAWQAERETHGSHVLARREMPPEDYGAMMAAMRSYLAGFDRGESGEVVYDAEYLEVVVHVRR